DGRHARPQRAACIHGRVRHRLRAGGAGRCDRRARPRNVPRHGAGARQHRVRRRGDRRSGLADRRPRGVVADRYRADVRGGAGRFGRGRAGRRGRARARERRAARPVAGDDRADRADPALRPADCDAHPAADRSVRDARDVSTATTRPLAVAGVARAARARQYGLWIAAAVLLLALPQVVRSGTGLAIMNQMGIAIVFALSYNMLLGQGGMLSFGHAVYFGLGGFIAAHVLNLAGRGVLWMPVPLLPMVGGLGGLACAALFGSFSTRRAGTVFAMISLGVAEL